MRVVNRFLPLIILSAALATAQFSSNIQGVIQDPTSSLIPNASVKLTNVETGVALEAHSNNAGYYRFSSLAPGDYELTVNAPGFQSRTLKVALTTGQVRDANVSLDVEGSTQSVQVSGEVELLDTAETRQQLTLRQDKVRDLPLLNNSIFSLLALAPGVVGVNGAPDNFNPEYFSGISANGRSAYGNSFNVDGLNVTSNITNGTANIGLNPESVGEVTIETNTFKAEQGLGSSIVVSITTKAGTNQYHGAGNYWFTNQDMRARTSLPFVARYNPFARQNVNGAFGGPIIKNKTFFFSSVEMLRSKDGAIGVETYESPEFVGWARANFPGTVGTKLLTENPIGGPVQTNVLRTAQQVLGADCGTAATANIPCDLPMVVQGSWSRSPYRNGLQYSFRGDQYLRGGNDRIYGSFIRTESENAALANRPTHNATSNRFVNAFQTSWTHMFSGAALNEFGFSGNKVQGEDGAGAPLRLPVFSVQGSTGVGPGFAGVFVQHNYNFREVFTWVRGSHTLKFGGTYYWGDDFAPFAGASGGAGSRPAFTYLNLLDLVRDQPFSGQMGAFDPVTGQPKEYIFGAKLNTIGAFVQDEWKIRPNLSLTASIRWDDFGNPTGIKGFQTTNLFVAPGQSYQDQFREAVIRPVDNMFPGRLNKNFSPRLGVAWSPGSGRNWVVRSGIGLYNDWITLGESVDRVNINPPNFVFPSFGVNLPLKLAPSIGTSDTFPFGFNLPPIPSPGLDARGGILGLQSNVGGLDPDLKTPRTVTWLAGVERQLPGRTVAGISYTGSYTWNGLVGTNFNRFAGDLLDGRLDRLNPSFGSMTYIINFNKIRYNGLTTSVRKDLGARGTIQGSYNLGRVTDYFQGGSRSVGFEGAVDPGQLGDRKADAAWDIRHRVSASGVYRFGTPFRAVPIVGQVLGGWELGTTAILQSGTPVNVANFNSFNPIRDANGAVTGFRPNSGDYNADGNNFDFPNWPGNLPQIYGREKFLGANAGQPAYNAADFTAPAPGVQGNLPRNYFRQQGVVNIDSSVIKNNRLPFLGEAGNLQLKFEFFNVINRVNLGGINGNTADFNFGRILSQGSPRTIQVGARLAF